MLTPGWCKHDESRKHSSRRLLGWLATALEPVLCEDRDVGQENLQACEMPGCQSLFMCQYSHEVAGQ